ncbi:putative V-type H+-transporting ATPase subunit c [Monocercomonoides exilis]|uniref:putative V-type H+-transporting ATPase subunit c n=1 Tax=Monocercomonoides exilis TaxID=2049356 RepID=UPI00355A73DF|nr:putative V-type H+-transporting ATPase subunit c [Monocercomonoides exilis]|eukprot:MONOS_2750.1-p1 / transcript=MONOS_2750.1 / gene=MONOS_2750 / organism=Monocercomonoides_exilis_PA203 / gene_product=V-type H / transcript_product=V-type H / location=Mono_scaffold00058:119734-120341(-) / protein_length=164 / sequence_SO=supercontig / SO=protein_coding / is_pseudo=false
MSIIVSELCPPFVSFYGFLGAAIGAILSNLGSAFGVAQSGIGSVALGYHKPELVLKSLLPGIMAGLLGIFGLIVAIIIMVGIKNEYTYPKSFSHLASGLSVGLSSLAAGITLGITGETGSRMYGREPKIFTGMLLVYIFGEALAVYGIIIAIIISASGHGDKCF